MKALVKTTAGPGFALREVPEPRIRENEVLIRVHRAGVCGTDVHIYEWDAWASGRCRPPFVVGHEFAGEVVETGALVENVRSGDRVTAEGFRDRAAIVTSADAASGSSARSGTPDPAPTEPLTRADIRETASV